MSLIDHSALQLLEKLDAGEVTSVEITRTYLDRIEKLDAAIKAFITVSTDSALEQAERIDTRRREGKPVGRLGGLPVALKDILCTKGERTTCGSRMLENFISPYDATVVSKLREADAVLIGRTNMDEFAMGGSTENSGFFPTRNPWNTDYVPGGSSGGSAAAVAAQMAPLAIGTDTGGSIRQPASYCGVVGLKPTYGRVSRYGVVAFASSLDQVGPFAQTVEDASLLLEVIAGHDNRDASTADVPVGDYSKSVARPLENLTVGLVQEHFNNGIADYMDATIHEAIDVYKSLGATVREVSLPHAKYAIASYYIVAPCEASSNLARFDGVHYGHRCDEKKMLEELEQERRELLDSGDPDAERHMDDALVRMYRESRSECFGSEVKRRIMLGTYALSAGYYDAYYLKALKARRLIRQDYDNAFQEVDIIAGPTTPTAAYKIAEKIEFPLAMYLGDLYTAGTNLAGIPAMSVPCGNSPDGLPIGLHIQAAPLQEEKLLRAGYMLQQATDWHFQRPKLS